MWLRFIVILEILGTIMKQVALKMALKLTLMMTLILVVLPRNYQETTKTTAEIIKEIMRENPVVSAAHIAVKVGISVNGVQYHIKKMKASGEIERIGSDRGGYWKVND